LNRSATSICNLSGSAGWLSALVVGLLLSGSVVFAADAVLSYDRPAARQPKGFTAQAAPQDRPAKPLISQARAGKTGRAALPAAGRTVSLRPPTGRPVRASASPGESGRALTAEIAAIEERIRWLALGVTDQERDLARMRGEEETLADEYRRIEAEKNRAGAFAAKLAKALWPLAAGSRLSAAQMRQASWDENDRRFWWLAAVSNQAASAATEYARQASLLAANLARGQAVRQDMERLREQVEKSREELGRERANLLSELARLRGDAFDLGAELAQLAQTAQPGKPAKAEPVAAVPALGGLKAARGKLPWPVAGELAGAPENGRGIGFSTAPAASVACVYPGVLVFAGEVRGMGEVAVVDHGQGYFSVYAYLEGVTAGRGKYLEAGQVIGQAGNYPPAGGFGVYFELRFHEKAINPEMWLVAGQ
jgi:septal ring factor EnvC (AmiA/AmiB activator)